MERFNMMPTPIFGLMVAERLPIGDDRGSFERVFCDQTFAPLGFTSPVRQINRSITRQRGTIRGLHFQLSPHGEDKLVSCLRGEVFDVAVDLRHGSPTCLRWHGEILSAANRRSLFIPKGFAHGLQTLSDDCELLYVHSAPYVAEAERGLFYADPKLSVKWPLPPAGLSHRDTLWPALTDDFTGIVP